MVLNYPGERVSRSPLSIVEVVFVGFIDGPQRQSFERRRRQLLAAKIGLEVYGIITGEGVEVGFGFARVFGEVHWCLIYMKSNDQLVTQLTDGFA